MADEQALLIDHVIGSKATDDGKHGLIGIITGGVEFALAANPQSLTGLALAALTAKAQVEASSSHPAQLGDLQSVETFPCERWEVGISPDGASMILSFRMTGGGWVRFQAPRQWATPMRETLEVIEQSSTRP